MSQLFVEADESQPKSQIWIWKLTANKYDEKLIWLVDKTPQKMLSGKQVLWNTCKSSFMQDHMSQLFVEAEET